MLRLHSLKRFPPLILVLIVLGLMEFFFLIARSEQIPILIGNKNAAWIKEDTEVNLLLSKKIFHSVFFKREIEAGKLLLPGVIHIKAYRTARIYLNDNLVAKIIGVNALIASGTLNLTPYLKDGGSNTLLVVVSNDTGPPALFIDSMAPVFQTNEKWLVSAGDKPWRPVKDVALNERSNISDQLITPWTAFIKQWKFYIALFILGASFALGWQYFLNLQPFSIRITPHTGVSIVRYILYQSLLKYYILNSNQHHTDFLKSIEDKLSIG